MHHSFFYEVVYTGSLFRIVHHAVWSGTRSFVRDKTKNITYKIYEKT